MNTELIEDIVITEDEKTIIQEALAHPREAIRDLVKNNFFFFMLYFWDTYSDDKFISNWHIEKIALELEDIAWRVGDGLRKDHDLNINVPPGSTKTALVSIFWPIWCWTNWHWMRFIASSHSDGLSKESAEYSRDIVRHDKFRDIFPDIRIKQDKDTKSNFRVEKLIDGVWRRGGNRLSTSVESKMATGFHAHIIIWDDLVDPHAAISKAKLEQAVRHMDQTLATRKVNKEVTTTVGIAQRLSPNDPSGHWLAKGKKNIRCISLPGEIKNYREYLKPAEWVEFYTDNLLDSNRLSWKALDELREDLGQYGYHGQIGQNPILAGAGMFEIDKISIIETMPHDLKIENTVRYWDKAGSEGEGAFTAGVKMAKTIDKKYIVVNVKKGQWASNTREEIIRNTAEADGRKTLIGVEQEPGSGGLESAQSTIKNLAGFHAYRDRPTGDKVYRADPYSVQVNDGNVYLLRGDWNQEYLNELRDFPNSTYKDQVDASSGAFSKLSGKRKVKVGRQYQ